MKVRELIDELGEVNQEAEIEVIVHNYPRDFEICFGGSDGCDKETCDSVSIYANEFNEKEKERMI